jgi:hypothetical protein
MEPTHEFYLCATCFHVTETDPERHEHAMVIILMIHYPGYPVGHRQLQPLIDSNGNLKAGTPRWFRQRRETTWPIRMKRTRTETHC